MALLLFFIICLLHVIVKIPKFKGRTTSRGEWSEENMKRAIQYVLDRKMSERAAAERYEFSRTSLQDHVKAVKKEGQQIILKPILGRFQQTFSLEYERQLCQHVIDIDNRLMPLTISEILRFAYDLAEKIYIDHRFNKEKRMAGKDFFLVFKKRNPDLAWMAGKDFFLVFKKRNPDLALRTPEETSLMRATGFNKPQVDRFYDLLLKLQEQFGFQASQIYNTNETEVSTVQKSCKVLSVKGKKQIGKLISAERGRNVTVIFSMNATSNFIPPTLIFLRKNG